MNLRWVKRDIFNDIKLLPENMKKTGRPCLIGNVTFGRDVPFYSLLILSTQKWWEGLV